MEKVHFCLIRLRNVNSSGPGRTGHHTRTSASGVDLTREGQQCQKVWTAIRDQAPYRYTVMQVPGRYQICITRYPIPPLSDFYYTVSDTSVNLRTHENKQDLTGPINAAFKLRYKTIKQTHTNSL
jgi:hypothetical protein